MDHINGDLKAIPKVLRKKMNFSNPRSTSTIPTSTPLWKFSRSVPLHHGPVFEQEIIGVLKHCQLIEKREEKDPSLPKNQSSNHIINSKSSPRKSRKQTVSGRCCLEPPQGIPSVPKILDRRAQRLDTLGVTGVTPRMAFRRVPFGVPSR